MNSKTIKTKRLTLRRFNENDALMMFKNWASNPNVTKFLTRPTHKDVDVTKMVLNNWIKEYDEGAFNWAIVLNEISEPIGNISVVNYDKVNNILEIGYVIGEKFWNNGYASEALKAVLQYLSDLGYKNMIAKHDICNPSSGKVMKKAGMIYSHTEKECIRNNRGLADCDVYKFIAK